MVLLHLRRQHAARLQCFKGAHHRDSHRPWSPTSRSAHRRISRRISAVGHIVATIAKEDSSKVTPYVGCMITNTSTRSAWRGRSPGGPTSTTTRSQQVWATRKTLETTTVRAKSSHLQQHAFQSNPFRRQDARAARGRTWNAVKLKGQACSCPRIRVSMQLIRFKLDFEMVDLPLLSTQDPSVTYVETVRQRKWLSWPKPTVTIRLTSYVSELCK